jgi:hypothetical protein
MPRATVAPPWKDVADNCSARSTPRCELCRGTGQLRSFENRSTLLPGSSLRGCMTITIATWPQASHCGQAIEFLDGVVQQSNFHDHPRARVPMTPEIGIASIREAGVMRIPVMPAISPA